MISSERMADEELPIEVEVPAHDDESPEPRPVSGGRSPPGVLGRYHLGCKIASGGMATVHLALPADSTFITRPVALKRIHPHLSKEDDFVAMFIDEARIASRLSHPNLCGVLDFGEADGSFFMTMEYMVGEPLAVLMRALRDRKPPMAPKLLARIAAQIVADACEGLHAAHELRDDDGESMRVVHRDVSPSNLFVTYDGLTRVVDFGIASAAHRLHHTSAGTLKGKFGYMAPEQIRGKAADRRADIWGLGVVLFEVLAQRRLFRRENPSMTVLATLEAHVPPLEAEQPGVPRDLRTIVRRALTRDPDGRYPTAAAMAEDLQRFLARSGTPSGRREVAEALRGAFPQGEAKKRALLKGVVEERQALADISPSGTDGGISRTGIKIKERQSADGIDTERPRSRTPIRALWKRRAGQVSVLSIVALGAATLAIIDRGTSRIGGVEAASLENERPPVDEASARSLEAPKAPTEASPEDAPEDAVATGSRSPSYGGERRSAPAGDTDEGHASSDEGAPTRVTRADSPGTPSPSDEAATDPAAETTRRAAERRAAAARRPGVVSVVTVGDWAQVYHRGRLLGPTPGRFTLPSGRQTLILRPGGGGAVQRAVVHIRSGRAVRLRREL